MNIVTKRLNIGNLAFLVSMMVETCVFWGQQQLLQLYDHGSNGSRAGSGGTVLLSCQLTIATEDVGFGTLIGCGSGSCA